MTVFSFQTKATLPRSLPICICATVKVQDSEDQLDERGYAHHQNGASLPFQDGSLFNLVFKSRRLLQTGDPERPAFEMIFEWSSSEEQRYLSPGEAIGIVCPNDEVEVEKTLRLLGMTGAETVEVSATGNDAARKRFDRNFQYVPQKCSVRHLFTYVVDLRTVLKKVFLKVLGDCCPEDSEDRRKLYEMSSIAESYTKHVLESRMMIFNILEEFPLCSPTLSVLIENLSRLGPRFYSVANYDSERVRIMYRPMTFCSLGKTLLGQCSTYFESMDDVSKTLGELSIDNAAGRSMQPSRSSNLQCYLRKNVRNFTFPCDNCTSFMFICHGTGIAPLEAYLDRLEKSDSSPAECERWVFYGCRDISTDGLFSIERAQKLGLRVVLRQSRAEPGRGYIQSAIPDHSEDFVRVVKKCGGHVLICGDYNTMAAESLAALKGVLNDENEPELVSELLQQNRIKLDVWT